MFTQQLNRYKQTGSIPWSPPSLTRLQLRCVEIAREVRTAVVGQAIKTASLRIDEAVFHQRISKTVSNVGARVVDVFGDHFRSKERPSLITADHELKDTLINARHPLDLLDHQFKISPDCVIIPPFSSHIHSSRVLSGLDNGNGVASNPFGVTLWSSSITNETRSTADHARARSLCDATKVSTPRKRVPMVPASARSGFGKPGTETMSKSQPHTHQSIAPGQVECPHCNEYVEAISEARGFLDCDPARTMQPCGCKIAHVPDRRQLEDVESFVAEDGDQEIHDINTGGRWIKSDTTVQDLGVDLR